MRKPLVLLILPLLFLALSCKKKSEDPSPRPLLMTINVDGNYFNPILGGVLFISDMNGKVLSDTFCPGNGTYRFYGASGTSAPKYMEVTSVKYDPYWHSFNIVIETYTRISSSEWTLKGYRADTAGKVRPVYVNIPAHSDAILISSSGYSNLTSSLEPIPIQLYKTPDEIYFGIPTVQGMMYKWFSNVHANTTDTFDLSNPEPSARKNIAFPFTAQYYECRVQGFPDGNFNSPIPFLVDELLSDGQPANNFFAYFPPARFQGFHTEIMALENWTSGQSWLYHTDGEIPSDFRKIQASLTSFVSTQNSLSLKTSGTLDAVSGTWKFENPYQGKVEWTVFGPDTTTFLQLPAVAPSLNAMFPWFSRDSLTFEKTELIDLLNIQGYIPMVSVLFNPSAPSSPERQETSKLSVAAPGK